MSATVEEYKALLGVDIHVNLSHLSSLASYGIPKEVRGEVWLHFLHINRQSRHVDLPEGLEDIEDVIDPEVLRKVRLEVKRSPRLRSLLPKTQKVMEKIICRYALTNLEGDSTDFKQEAIHLLAPLINCLPDEAACDEAFQALMQRLEPYLSSESKKRRLADTIMLLRAWLPELYVHFEEEGMETTSWAIPLINSFLSNCLPSDCLLRLWDTYIAKADGFDLHIYVCVAILNYCQDDLLELDAPDIKAFLLNLPVMDIDQLILQAYSIKEDSELLREELEM